MPEATDQVLEALRRHATAAAARAYVPYSGRKAAAALLLSDGAWVPGVRVESASFSLIISPLLNAFTTLVTAGRQDVVAVAQSHPFLPEDRAFLETVPYGPWRLTGPDACVLEDVAGLPEPGDPLSPFLTLSAPVDPADGIRLARKTASRAYVPASRFPVGVVLETEEGALIPGVNVEHEDWSRVLCAERNALGTALSYGHARFRRLYLTLLKDPLGSPCGACRQLLVELAPGVDLWMDRGSEPPTRTEPEALLPGFFAGEMLQRHA